MLEESKFGFQTGRNYAKFITVPSFLDLGSTPQKKLGGPKKPILLFFVPMDRIDRQILVLANSYQLVGQDSGGSKEMANCQFPGATFRGIKRCPRLGETPGILSPETGNSGNR